MLQLPLLLILLIPTTPQSSDPQSNKSRTVNWNESGCVAESKRYIPEERFMEEEPPLPVPCESIVVDGYKVRIIHDNGINLAVTVDSSEEYLVFNIQVLNSKASRILVDPANAELAFADPKKKDDDLVIYKPVDPKRIAQRYLKDARWANMFRSLGASLARRTTTVDTMSSGSVLGTGGSAVYSGSSTATISEPDEARRRQAARDNAQTTTEANSKASEVLSAALKANTVFPGERVGGDVYFKYPNNKVGKVLFSFALEGTDYFFVYSYGRSK